MNIVKVDNKEVLCSDINEWDKFIEWVSQTSLFNAIKTLPSGTEIRGHGPDGDINLELFLRKDRIIDTPMDLPKEILFNFFYNSPWYSESNNQIQNLLTNDQH